MDTLVKGFPEVFNDKLGEIHSFKSRLVLKEGAQPIFCRPRSVPFAIKEQIKMELEKNGPVNHSEWATIVPVPKPDRSIRICGDFKITVNSALHVDQYPLPIPEELSAMLAGGKQFMKLNLSNAYQQLPLDNGQEKCVLLIHIGVCISITNYRLELCRLPPFSRNSWTQSYKACQERFATLMIFW